MNFKRKSYLFMAVLYLFLLLFPSISSAHAYIKKSNPIENEILKKSPSKITIQFDESIQPEFNSIQVFDSNGNRVDQKNGRIDPNHPSILESGLVQNLPKGTYRIQWKVVSNDGHPVEGVIPFQVGTSAAKQDTTIVHQATKGYTPHLDLIVIRWIQYVSNACYVGLLFFYLVVLPKEAVTFSSVGKILPKLLGISFILLCMSILLSLPLEATIQASISWSKVFNFQTLQDVIRNTLFGHTWLAQIAILFILTIITWLFCRNPAVNPLLLLVAFALGLGMLLTKALTSHAASSTNKFLSLSMDFAHLLAASIWIGSLIGMVALLPLAKKPETKNLYLKMIHKFSKWGIILVLLLSFTGVFGSLSYIPNLASLIHTDYGRVLSGKVILLLLMLILATVNFLKGKRGREKGLVFSIWSELSIGIIILLLSVFLTNLPTAMSSPGPFQETKTLGNGKMVSLRVTPNIIGENVFEVTLKNKNGQPIKDIEQIILTFTSLDMEMGKDSVNLIKVKNGKYRVKGMHFNMSGNWKVNVHVLTKALDSIDTDFRVIVGSQ